MSGGGRFWGFVAAFVRAFTKSAQEAQRKGQQGSSQQANRAGKPALKNAPQAPRTNQSSQHTQPAGALESPGQFGPGATRDLTSAEVRSLVPSYAPNADGDPDPGEIVWTWVPYAEHDGRGKDRPVLIIARLDDGATAGCYLSTKEHRGFVSIGSGPWDSQGRESFVSPERVLRVTEEGMRREGHVLGRDMFQKAVAEILR